MSFQSEPRRDGRLHEKFVSVDPLRCIVISIHFGELMAAQEPSMHLPKSSCHLGEVGAGNGVSSVPGCKDAFSNGTGPCLADGKVDRHSVKTRHRVLCGALECVSDDDDDDVVVVVLGDF